MNNFIGIDVSNNTLDIYIKQSNTFSQVQNNYKTISDFFKKEIKFFEKIIVIYESTGVYSSSLTKVCIDFKINHYEVNPRAMNQLGKNIGDRNKTDKIDAEKIANIGQMLYEMEQNGFGKSRLSFTSDNNIKYLKSILSAIHSCKQDIKKSRQRISALKKDIYAPNSFLQNLNKNIISYQKIKNKLVDEAIFIINKLDVYSKFKNIMTIPSVNNEVGLELIIFFINLADKGIGISDRSKVKAFAGIDVSLQQSGTSINKKRISKQGNKNVRSILQVGTRCWYSLVTMDKYKNTNLGLFFQRMIDKFSTPTKKNGNSISTAMSRKILLIAWGIFWNDTPYNWS